MSGGRPARREEAKCVNLFLTAEQVARLRAEAARRSRETKRFVSMSEVAREIVAKAELPS